MDPPGPLLPWAHEGLAHCKRDVRSGRQYGYGEHVVYYPRPGDLGTASSITVGEVPPEGGQNVEVGRNDLRLEPFSPS
jgi:hypothetical protein